MRRYLLQHVQVLLATSGQLARTPLATLMTIAVIGITLALPASLYLVLDNLLAVTGGWERGGQISLFLEPRTSEAAADSLAQRLRRLPEIQRVDYIAPSAALAEFKRLSGFGDTLDLLESNPLPAVMVVRPKAGMDTAALTALVRRLNAESAVDLAQLDLEWVQRLQAMLRVAERGVHMLAGLLALAVALIIGNTIRLAVLNRRTEIEVIKLIGGTDAFVRRPFLYAGTLQGTLGALTAWLLVTLGLALLSGPIGELSGLYGSPFEVRHMSLQAFAFLVAGGGLLGYAGSRLAVQRHLREIT